ncbi:hypothetical protein ABVK25_009881 [Lepraria finkii]|uniref:Uncharacterized protein n=1 Tax=Lepraria finkii TaxID=1340010 RepID=A0ABR4AW50_9LECA
MVNLPPLSLLHGNGNRSGTFARSTRQDFIPHSLGIRIGFRSQQFVALSALKECPNVLVPAWLHCARRINLVSHDSSNLLLLPRSMRHQEIGCPRGSPGG